MKSILKVAFLIFVFAFKAYAENVGPISADSYFNQGNTAYNNGNFGDAVFQYEKALILDPSSSDIKTNLQLAIERLDADIVELDPFFLADWWSGLSNLFLPGGWKLLSLLFFFILLGLVYVLFFKEVNKPKVFYFLGAILFFLMLISIWAGNSRANSIYNNHYAIINEGADALFLGPDPVSEKIKPVVSGVKVKILDFNNDWYKVATMDSEQGWIEKKKVRLLKL